MSSAHCETIVSDVSVYAGGYHKYPRPLGLGHDYLMRPLLSIPEIVDTNRDYILDNTSCEFIGWVGNIEINMATLLQDRPECYMSGGGLRCPWSSMRLKKLRIGFENLAPMLPEKLEDINWYEFVSAPGVLAAGINYHDDNRAVTDQYKVKHLFPTMYEIMSMPISITGRGEHMELNLSIDPAGRIGRFQTIDTSLFTVYLAYHMDHELETGPSPGNSINLRLRFRAEFERGNVLVDPPMTTYYPNREPISFLHYMMAVNMPVETNARCNHLLWNLTAYPYRLRCAQGLNFVWGYAQNPVYPFPAHLEDKVADGADDFVFL